MTHFYIPHPEYPARKAWAGVVKTLLGIQGALPAGGTTPRVIGVVQVNPDGTKLPTDARVWVEPLRGTAPANGKRHTHRVMAACPHCNVAVSAGRLAQHRCK